MNSDTLRPISPKILGQILQRPLRYDLVIKGGGRFKVLADLDASARKIFSSLEIRNLHNLVIMEVSLQIKTLPMSIRLSRFGPLPPNLNLEGLGLKARTYNCLVNADYNKSPDLLANATIENIIAIRNFGATSLVDLLTAYDFFMMKNTVDESFGKSELLSEAKKLALMKHAKEIRSADPRLGAFVSKLNHLIKPQLKTRDSGNWCVLDIAEMLLSKQIEPKDNMAMAIAIRELRVKVRRLFRLSLEQELEEFLGSATSPRNRKIIARRLGCDGKGGSTLEEAGSAFNITRERVRQIENKIIARINRSKYSPFAPILDKALLYISNKVPATADNLARAIAAEKISKEPFDIRGLKEAGTLLKRKVPFIIERIGKNRIVVLSSYTNLAARIISISRRLTEFWGVVMLADLVFRIGEVVGKEPDRAFVEEVLRLHGGIDWLDKAGGWFWIPSVPRNRLINQIEKIMAVAPRIHISELRAGAGRHYRMKGYSPPRRVLLEFCKHMQGYRVEGEFVIADPPLNRSAILTEIELKLVNILMEHGPLIVGTDFEKFVSAMDINRSIFMNKLVYSPIFARYAQGVYGLRGANFPVGYAESLIPKVKREKVVQDHGWTKKGGIWIAYKLTTATIASGLIAIPASLKEIIFGAYALKSEEGSDTGNLIIKELTARGLMHFFRRRGIEAGDVLILIFNISERTVVSYLGDDDLIDQIASGELLDNQGFSDNKEESL